MQTKSSPRAMFGFAFFWLCQMRDSGRAHTIKKLKMAKWPLTWCSTLVLFESIYYFRSHLMRFSMVMRQVEHFRPLVNGTGWHQAGGDKASATALLVNSIRNSPTQQLVGTSLASQLNAINHQSLSSSPVLQQLTTQQQQQVQAAQQQQQQYGSGIRWEIIHTFTI